MELAGHMHGAGFQIEPQNRVGVGGFHSLFDGGGAMAAAHAGAVGHDPNGRSFLGEYFLGEYSDMRVLSARGNTQEFVIKRP